MKIALCGYKGKTGSRVYETLLQEGYDVIGIEKNESSLLDVIETVDLVIDFTSKIVSLKHILICIDYRKPFIVACTSFTYDELAYIKSLCNLNKIKGGICYNFSLPLNYILNGFNFFNNYFNEFTYYDVHHVSKIDKVSGTTYLFLLKNKRFKVKSTKTNKNSITYVIQMRSKYDKMILTYQVDDKKAFALGLLNYLKTKDDNQIINLLN